MVRFIIGQRVIVAKKGKYHGLVGTIVKKKAGKYLVEIDNKKAEYFKPTEIFVFEATKHNVTIDCRDSKPDEVKRVLDTLEFMRTKNKPETISFTPKFKIGDKVVLINHAKRATDRIRSIIFKRIGDKDYIAYSVNSFAGEYLEDLLRKDEPLLDKQERRFLRNLLVPVKAISVIKRRTNIGHLEYLVYRTQNEFDNDSNELRLPAFPTNYMYKNLELDREYSLAELGIK